MFGIFKGLALERKDEEENRGRSVEVMKKEPSSIGIWREMKEAVPEMHYDFVTRERTFRILTINHKYYLILVICLVFIRH